MREEGEEPSHVGLSPSQQVSRVCLFPSRLFFPIPCWMTHLHPTFLPSLSSSGRSTMAWGLEARVPFLDKEFLEVAMNIRPEDKVFSKGTQEKKDVDGRPMMEKYILRKAFDVAPDGRVSLYCFCFLGV